MLTPRTTLSACPGDEILVTCNESDTAAMISLRWTLTFQNRRIHAIETNLPNIGTPNNESASQLFIDEQELKFLSKLTSYSPLIGTFMTTAHPVLNGATVTCQSTISIETLTIRVLETGKKS